MLIWRHAGGSSMCPQVLRQHLPPLLKRLLMPPPLATLVPVPAAAALPLQRVRSC